jgi:hypothetical protein
MDVNIDTFPQSYMLFPTNFSSKKLEDLTKEELASFTKKFIDLEAERFSIISSSLCGQLPFNTSEEKVVTVATLIAASRQTDGDAASAATLSLCYDFACAVRSYLHSIDPEIDWRYQLKYPRAVSYTKPVIARKNFSGAGFIDARVTAHGGANYAFQHNQDIKDKILNMITKQMKGHFGIEFEY